MKAYVQTKCKRKDGSLDCFLTVQVEVKETETLPRKGQTIGNLGSHMPTHYMIKYNNRWQRVKCIYFCNLCVFFIGNKYNPLLTVDIER